MAVCFMSLPSFASYVTALCNGNYTISDANGLPNGDYYHVYLDVISEYPTLGTADLGIIYSYGPQSIPPNTPVANVWYENPANEDYYTMGIRVYKYNSSNVQIGYGSGYSYGEFTVFSGSYYLTALNTIPVTVQ